MGSDELRVQVRAIVAQHARLPAGIDVVGDDDDLYDAGMGSHSAVSIMIALEGAFDVEFPDTLLNKGTFRSIASICAAVTGLLGSPAG